MSHVHGQSIPCVKSNPDAVNAILPSIADQARIPFVDYTGMALAPGQWTMPKWMREEGLCILGCWETMPWRRYIGIATTWEEQDYAFEQSQAFIDDVKKLGCNTIAMPYDCGHGVDTVEDQVQRSKALIELCHKNGLKGCTYFRPDIIWYDTLNEAEKAELDGGYQIDGNGRLVQPFGSAERNLCYHHAGVLNRFKRQIRRAIVELKADMIHIDGMIVGGDEPKSACRCPLCVADFRKFLVSRYGHDRELAKRRFGHACLEQIMPPFEYPLNYAPYDSGPYVPVWCEWVAFRCHWTSRILAEVAALVKSLNPEVVIKINSAMAAPRENAAMFLGTDIIGMGHYCDASYSEDGYPPAIVPDGKIIHRVRQFKFSRQVDTRTITYMEQSDQRQLRQNLAHAAAFNLGTIGCLGFTPHMNFSNRYNVHFEVKCDFVQWLNKHREYYRDVQSAARIAVWRPREGMAMSGRLAYAAAMRMEQLLVETRRGFDVIFDESVTAIAKYDLVIIPSVECMSLDQIKALHEYVHNGGRLFVGQDSAMFDTWHRRRIENPWEGLFGDASAKNVVADALAVGIAGVFVEAKAAVSYDKVAYSEVGKGRAVYAPMVVDPATQPSMNTVLGGLNTGLDHTNWVVPERAEEFNLALDWLLEDRQHVRIAAQRGMLAEYIEQPSTGRTMVHLVNLCKEPTVQSIITIQAKIDPSRISVLYPPTDIAPRWRAESDGDRTRIVFDQLDVYAVVVIRKA
ncbi:MAG: hypothetical protein IT440_01220 [Phycisphaeraceae bacterium]|nr:hypothetical protein [Phycisphaeraceae bacterium]